MVLCHFLSTLLLRQQDKTNFDILEKGMCFLGLMDDFGLLERNFEAQILQDLSKSHFFLLYKIIAISIKAIQPNNNRADKLE